MRYEKKEYVLDDHLDEELTNDAIEEDASKHKEHRYHSVEVSCLMLATMPPELQKSCENIRAYEMNNQLKDMFKNQAL